MTSPDTIHVLLLAGRLEPRGSSAYTVRLAEHLPQHGVQPALVCSYAGCVPEPLRLGPQFEELAYLDFPLLGRFVVRDLVRRLRTRPPQLIHVQTPVSLWTGELLAASFQVPMVLTVHDSLPPHATFRFQPAQGGRIIAISDPVRTELLERTALDAELVQVIHSGVEVAPLETAAEAGRTVPVIGAAGPLEPLKGHAYFLRAARKVLDSGRDVEFLLAGSGPEEVPLRRLADELKIAAHVTFVPFVRQYSEILKAVDIFCLPSLQQGLGTVMLEAMALGKPVIATDVGGTSAIVRHDETGLVVRSRDADGLASRILELLADPARARRLGEAGYAQVRDSFHVEQMIEQTVRLYRNVLGLGVTLSVRHADE